MARRGSPVSDIAIDDGGAMKALRRAFRAVDSEATKELKAAYREVAGFLARAAQVRARTGTPLQRKMVKAIKPGATVSRGPTVKVSAAKTTPAAFPAFWGIERRLGWFAKDKYAAYTSQDQKLPKWVGNTWDTAVKGQGPYRINDAFADEVDRALDVMARAIAKAAERAGLD
jgi:hypothetical protein